MKKILLQKENSYITRIVFLKERERGKGRREREKEYHHRIKLPKK